MLFAISNPLWELLYLFYIVNGMYLDMVNLAFAKRALQKELKIAFSFITYFSP